MKFKHKVYDHKRKVGIDFGEITGKEKRKNVVEGGGEK